MQNRISAADATPIRVTIVTMDTHLASAAARAQIALQRDMPGLTLTLHAASEFEADEAALARCHADIARADILVCTMMFVEDHARAVASALAARREHCDALVACMSAGEVTKLTRMGGFTMDGSERGALALLKKLKPKTTPGKPKAPGGAEQMAMLRRIPKILRFIPGTAQDVRAYFLTLQYWLAGSEENIAQMVRALIDRYAAGPRAALRGRAVAAAPEEYPETGLYHPRMAGRIGEALEAVPGIAAAGTVGVLVLRSYVLAGNTRHYDGAIAALEARGLKVVPAFAAGLDARPAISRFFMADGVATVDAVVSLTGFSLVGGPAYNDSRAAEEILGQLGVPYVAAHPVEFQTLEAWGASERGLLPVEATVMVAIPELDGATGSMVFGGRSSASGETCTGCARACRHGSEAARDMQSCPERAEMLAARVARLVALRRSERAARRIGIVLFSFPPNAGNIGTAACLAVFASLFNTLRALKAAGYGVDLPASVEALRDAILIGNAARHGTPANVAARIPAEDHVRREEHLAAIEGQWGPAPGKQQSDGSAIQVLGHRFGNVFVGIQPGMGYEGDPMRLLFAHGFTPTHAFSAFYRYLREDFGANALLHFGTHGALEFMPGKQTGMSADCWPDRLVRDVPNFYFYAANNPSEGMIAKRRSAATLVSYLTPPVAQAGLYRGLLDVKASIARWRGLPPEDAHEADELAALIQAQAAQLDMAPPEPAWTAPEREIAALAAAIAELEESLIPHGLHVAGAAMSAAERTDMLAAVSDAAGTPVAREVLETLAAGLPAPSCDADPALLARLAETAAMLSRDHELPALIHALDGNYVRPAPGGDLIRTPEMLPTGRNLHGFDPFRLPSAYAMADGARQAQRLIDRHMSAGNALPETIALVLWGTDNLKSEGGPIAQALALMGARPRFDGYGRLAGAELVSLEALGRPRIDVVITLSGIFRDLLPLQTKLLAEAAYLAASADEPAEHNYIRRHALAHMTAHGCDLETAALRVFGNAEGAYGANVNLLLDNGQWEGGDELADTYTARKSFAYGRRGDPVQQSALLSSVLAGVDLAYQNLDSVELGVTTIDTYFDTLGGISQAVARAKGTAAPVYIGDQTRGNGTVRTLSEQVALETRTRLLNPKWHEGMLAHGYEGVRQIETHLTNTMGWSATTGAVAPWVYARTAETFVLDTEMRERLAALNPAASAKLAARLIEAQERNYWQPDAATLAALHDASDALEDRLEGIPSMAMEAAA